MKLIDTYVDKSDELEMVNANMVPPLMEAVLIDYARNVPDAREAEVLNVMTTIIHKLHVCSILLPFPFLSLFDSMAGYTFDFEAWDIMCSHIANALSRI